MPGAHGSGCGCRHEDDFLGISQLLLPWIDVDNVVGLNEDTPNTARRVFRPYDSRLDDTMFVESPDGDEELLVLVPLTSPVKVTGITVIGGDRGASPSMVRLFINREDLDFQTVGDLQPTQELELVEDFHGAVQHPLRAAKFVSVTQLALFFPASLGGLRTRIHWIGLWGVGSEYKRQAVVTVYEAVANPSEKQVKDESAPTQDAA
uniref:PITH domain-containing protein n=1 Tax=Alexandrium catenella TaxID=2925 RepID=A0A7S1WJ47_ALECA